MKISHSHLTSRRPYYFLLWCLSKKKNNWSSTYCNKKNGLVCCGKKRFLGVWSSVLTCVRPCHCYPAGLLLPLLNLVLGSRFTQVCSEAWILLLSLAKGNILSWWVHLLIFVWVVIRLVYNNSESCEICRRVSSTSKSVSLNLWCPNWQTCPLLELQCQGSFI